MPHGDLESADRMPVSTSSLFGYICFDSKGQNFIQLLEDNLGSNEMYCNIANSKIRGDRSDRLCVGWYCRLLPSIGCSGRLRVVEFEILSLTRYIPNLSQKNIFPKIPSLLRLFFAFLKVLYFWVEARTTSCRDGFQPSEIVAGNSAVEA